MKMKTILLTAVVALVSSSAFAEPANFTQSKKILSSKVYTNKDTTFYCGCDIYYKKKNWLAPSHEACGFEPRKQAKRAARIEWEHVVPAWYFGHQMQCWQEGGRKNCRNDKDFEKMEGDLHNLVPAIGEVNGDRSNYSLTMVSANIAPQYGQCDMKVDFKGRKAQPRESVRGDVARTYFYMADTYGLKLSKQDIQLYTAWDKLDPVSDDELRIHNLKARYQGWSNPYVTGERKASDYKNGSLSNPKGNTNPSSGIKDALNEFSQNFEGGDEMINKFKTKLKDMEF